MNCPHCSIPLAMSDRHGVEIDYCPQCRGVWLDRGELDKIIERAGLSAPVAPAVSSAMPPAMPQTVPPPMPGGMPYRRDYDDDDDDDRRYRGQGDVYPKKKKKEGFLSDLFDF